MDNQVKRNIEEFKRRKVKQLIVAVVAVPTVVFLMSLRDLNVDPKLSEYGQIAGFALILGLLIFSFKNWRCPACERYLGKSGIPRFCPQCAAQIGQ